MAFQELRLFITGVEYRIVNDYQIREKVGQSDMANVTALVEEGDTVPVSQQLLQIRQPDGVTNVYSGIIQAVDSPVWSTGLEVYLVSMTVKSLDVIFDYRVINEAFSAPTGLITTTEIVQAIYDDYLAEEGLTLGTIGTFTRGYDKYVCSALKMRQVLDELGDSVNAAAHITADGVFNFVSDNEFQEVTPPTKLTKLKKQESGIKLKTVQRLSGANEETSQQASTETWAANQTNYILDYQVSVIDGITINGSPATFGVRGVDEVDTTKTFLYKFGENVISVNPNATTKPTTGDTVATLYLGFFSIEIIQENEGLKESLHELNGTSGKIESVLVDTSITSYADGEKLAEDLLDEGSEREETINCTYVGEELGKTAILNLWNLQYQELGISGQYVIVERSISYFADLFKVTLKLKNKNFYSRAGTVLFKDDKQINNLSVRTDDLVFKTSQILEVANFVDDFDIQQSGIIYYPGSTDIFTPGAPGASYYPI